MKDKCQSPEQAWKYNAVNPSLKFILNTSTDINKATSSVSCSLCGEIWKRNCNYDVIRKYVVVIQQNMFTMVKLFTHTK